MKKDPSHRNHHQKSVILPPFLRRGLITIQRVVVATTTTALVLFLSVSSSSSVAFAWEPTGTTRTPSVTTMMTTTRGLPALPRYAPGLRRSSFRPTTSRQFPPRRRRYHVGAVGMTMMPEGPECRVLVDRLQGAVGRRLAAWRFLSGRYASRDDDYGGSSSKPTGWEAFRQTMTPWYSTNTTADDDDSGDSNTDAMTAVDRIQEWNCKGKFLYMILDDGAKAVPSSSSSMHQDDFARSIWITLGMTGRFVPAAVHDANTPEEKHRARWYLEVMNVQQQPATDGVTPNAITRIYYYDTRNFGTLTFCLSRQALADKLRSLGPDILDTQNTTVDVYQRIVAATKPTMNICRFLMDQSKLSGVGNYLLAEGLYRARIDPYATLQDLTMAQHEVLFDEIQCVARESYASQDPTTGERGRADDGAPRHAFALQCYGRQVAERGERVYKDVHGPHGRTIWYTREQRLSSSRRRQREYEESSATSDAAAAAATIPNHEPADDSSSSQTPPTSRLPADPVQDLMSQLTEPSWREALSSNVESSDWFAALAQFVFEERRSQPIYPPPHQVFAALNLCPLDQVKVVIVGQDPYHGYGQGHGLAFSVQRGVKPPPSLVNVFKEVQADVGTLQPYPPPHGNLEHWARQGVLLLNSVLTVRRGQANSHARQGWERFTDVVVDVLNHHDQSTGQRDAGLVFLLWGRPAQRKAAGVDESRHLVIRSSHPSPLGATKTDAPFLGSRCFSRTNRFLEQTGREPIDWNVT